MSKAVKIFKMTRLGSMLIEIPLIGSLVYRLRAQRITRRTKLAEAAAGENSVTLSLEALKEMV